MEPAALHPDPLLHALQPRSQRSMSLLPKPHPHWIKLCHKIYLKKTNNVNANTVATNEITGLSFRANRFDILNDKNNNNKV